MSALVTSPTYYEVFESTTDNLFVGSPTPVQLSDGTLIVSFVEFGSASGIATEDGGKRRFYRSTDSGATWTLISTLNGSHNGPVWVDGDDNIYVLCMTSGAGTTVDMRAFESTDGGETWSSHQTIYAATGTRRVSLGACPPIVVDDYYCGVFHLRTSANFSAFPPPIMVAYCVPVDEVMTPASWTFSAETTVDSLEAFAIHRDTGWAIRARRHEINSGLQVGVTWNSVTPSITLGTPATRDILGGDVMWDIARHPTNDKYYALVNPHTDYGYPANEQRNSLELLEVSTDAQAYTPIAEIFRSYPDENSTDSGAAGFQYAGWLRDTDGKLKIIDGKARAAIRVGWDAGSQAGASGHNSNRIWYAEVPLTATRKRYRVSASSEANANAIATAIDPGTMSDASAHEAEGFTVQKGANGPTPVTNAVGSAYEDSGSQWWLDLDETLMIDARDNESEAIRV